MIFKSVQLQGFGSYVKPATLSFPEGPGFYLMTGENIAEPDLGRNGTGKSTAFESMVWCLFGKTTQGLKANSIGCWKADKKYKTKVSVIFSIGEDDYELTRTWKPNTLIISVNGDEGKTVDQEKIENIIGIDFTGFLRTICQGQHSGFFLDLGPADKLAVFTEVMQLDRWLKSGDKAKEKLKDIKGQADSINLELTKAQTKRVTLGEQLKSMKEKLEEAQVSVDDEVKQLERELEKEKSELKKIKVEGKQAQDARDQLDCNLDIVAREYNEVNDLLKTAEKKVTDLQFTVREAQSEKKRIDADIAKLREDSCPTCGQKLPKKEREAQIKIKNKAIAGMIADVISPGEKTVKFAQRESAKFENDLNELQATKHRKDQAHTKAKEIVRNLKQRRNNANYNIERIEKDLKKCGKQTKILKQTITEIREERVELKDVITDHKAQLKIAEKIIASYEYWASGGFKQVRLYLVELALKEFEVTINNSLVQLGLRNWSVKLSAERTTANKTVSKGFFITVKAPHSVKEVPMEVWSGGELHRLKLATGVALSQLIKARSGFDCNLRIWDEPTTHLSSEGVNDLLEFFENQTQFKDEQIWLIDHLSLDFGGFDGIYSAIKDEDGSRIEQLK